MFCLETEIKHRLDCEQSLIFAKKIVSESWAAKPRAASNFNYNLLLHIEYLISQLYQAEFEQNYGV